MTFRILGVLFLPLLCCVGEFAQPVAIVKGTATIYGRVLDENDAIAAITSVTATRVAPTIQTYSAVVSPLTGGFGFEGIPAGTYELCAQPAGTAVVDECQWTHNRHVTKLEAGQTVADVRVGVRQSTLLRVRVDDPSHFAAAKTAAKSSASAMVLTSVISPHGAVHPLAVESSDDVGTSYWIAIPVDLPLQLFLFTPHMAMSDMSNLSKSVALAGTSHIFPFRHARGALAPPSFKFAATAGALP